MTQTSRRRVLGIYFPQRQDTLLNSTQEFCAGFNREGYAAEVVNAGTPEGLDLLVRRLEENNLAFCFGIQGVGSNLKTDTTPLWTAYRVPFLGVHFDHPCHNPLNHVNESSYVANLYHCESFLDARNRFFDIPQMNGLLPHDTTRLPEQLRMMDFAERPIRLLYVKTGDDLQKYVDDINRFLPAVRDATWQQLERAKQDPNLHLCDLTQEIFESHGYDRRVYERQFWGVVQAMDMYLRTWRSCKLVDWLKFQEGAVIIGDGWDAIDREGAKAEFLPTISVGEAFALFYRTQFICNTNPYGSDAVHERVISGLLGGACVISDTNAWWDKNFADVPALTRFDWTQSLDDQILPVINDPSAAAEASKTGIAPAIKHFTGSTSFRKIIDYASRLGAQREESLLTA